MKRTALALLVLSLSASAANLGFTCTTNNTGSCNTNLAPYFSASLNDLGGGQVEFLLSNNLPGTGFITNVYFDEGDNNLFSGFTFSPMPGTNFTIGTTGTLPGGTPAPYSFATDHSATRVPGAGNANAVQPGETLKLIGTITSGFTFADVLTNLSATATNSSGLRVGFHLQGIGTAGQSDAFISHIPNDPRTPPDVPEPATYMLVGGALAGLAVYRSKARSN